MQILGFNFTKISAERIPEFKKSRVDVDIEFKDVKKQNLDILKDTEAVKISFKHSLNYSEDQNKEANQGHVSFEGNIILSVEKKVLKDIMKSWKKKTLPSNTTFFLSNTIMKRCASKAFQLQDDLALPTHIKIPSIRPPRE